MRKHADAQKSNFPHTSSWCGLPGAQAGTALVWANGGRPLSKPPTHRHSLPEGADTMQGALT
jgi:hypothetical protein